MSRYVVPDMDMVSFVRLLRRERHGMVQTEEQLRFCHLALADEIQAYADTHF